MSTAQLAARRHDRSRPLRRLGALGPLTTVAAAVCVLLVLAAIAAPVLAPHDPTAVDPLRVFAGASGAHPLGTDDTGRDLLSRLIYGARTSLAGPALVIVISSVVGTLLALTAAWNGGWVDAAISRLLDVLFAFPGLVVAVVAAAVFGAGFLAPVLALSLGYVPVIARILRSAAMRERRLPYVAALRLQGMSTARIWLRHLLPNLAPLILVQSAVGFGYAMLDLAAIAFLGLGVQPPSPNWGVMVAGGQPGILNGNPAQALYAALTVVIAVVAFNLVGERIAQHFEEAETR
jgi:peptide/nickel transport system permease protein